MPPSLTLEKLRHPHGSVPGNPLLAEPFYLTKYNERMGTGTGDMIRRSREVGLPEPLFSISDGFVTTIWRKPIWAFNQSAGEVKRVIVVIQGQMKRVEIQNVLGIRHEDYFRKAYLIPTLQANYIEMTIPDKPKSSQQRYRLTEKGHQLQVNLLKVEES